MKIIQSSYSIYCHPYRESSFQR